MEGTIDFATFSAETQGEGKTIGITVIKALNTKSLDEAIHHPQPDQYIMPVQ